MKRQLVKQTLSSSKSLLAIAALQSQDHKATCQGCWCLLWTEVFQFQSGEESCSTLAFRKRRHFLHRWMGFQIWLQGQSDCKNLFLSWLVLKCCLSFCNGRRIGSCGIGHSASQMLSTWRKISARSDLKPYFIQFSLYYTDWDPIYCLSCVKMYGHISDWR